jgi:hypothetical protein
MLCTSILSEIVLGFMMWTGWLGTSTWSEQHYPCPELVQVPAGQQYGPPVGTACPQACIAYPAPACPLQDNPLCPVDANGIEIVKILSLPPHLAACDMKDVFNRCAGTSMPCKTPCSWKIHSVVKSAAAGRVEVEFTLIAEKCDVKEVYKATKALVFDSVTDVTLEGTYPEPVCVRVVARPPAPPMPAPVAIWGQPSQACNQPFLLNGMPMLPPMPVAYTAPMPPIWNTGMSDPIPLEAPSPYAPVTYTAPLPIGSTPATLPAPTPVHRASVKLVYESGKARLCVKSAGMTTECLRMKLEAGAAGAVRLSAGKNRVHLAGNKWKAEADCIELGDDGRIVLAGHVKLTSDKLGVCAAVKAERLCVEVKAGKFEKIVESK